MSTNEPPKLPRSLSLAKLALTAWEVEGVMHSIAPSIPTLTPYAMRRITEGVRGSLRDVDPSYIYQTLMPYEGKRLSSDFCAYIARQLAGRRLELEKGPVSPCAEPNTNSWHIVQVVGVEECDWGDSGVGYLLSLSCRYGPPSGAVIRRKFPSSYLRWFAYQVGYTRRMTYQDDPQHFLGLLFWIYTEVEDGEEGYKVTACSSSTAMRKHNRDILKKRMRFFTSFKEDPCPHELQNDCVDCDVVDCSGHYGRYREC